MKTLHPHDIQKLLTESNAEALDVRTPVEFEEKHIDGAKHIPVDELPAQCGQLDPSKKYYLVCQSGKRAEKAHQILAEKGFGDLTILAGGVGAWEQAGLPLNRSERKVLPLMRQVQLAIGLGVLTFSLLAYFVHPAFVFGAAFFGAGLTMAGATGWCGLALLLAKVPWNKTDAPAKASCCVAN
ncbi:rhodanese-like domain-containing protein [Roseibacillus persicicus]|uniref:rhodanese-like domain-containing protein n=1 Tax=Roseibacillus persicicus TaxID=454148 RepID=UPI00280E33C8|nr:rhodanese-like domain-containing protein [Roseibacillus persicicus]MDQ8190327.1 rhodanese-like domain-containing protein [Roseibacillus persicicus]